MRYREYLRDKLADKIPADAVLPSGFHLVGYVALVHIKNDLMEHAKSLGEATLEFDGRIQSVAVKTGPTVGVERSPSYVVVAGKKETVTTHIEGGIKYKVDPLQLTFSGGNKKERIRMASLVQPDDEVLDMFACVGQFSLPMAKKSKARVHAIEINPLAFGFLVENIQLNSLSGRVTVVLGDCSKLHPINQVDRVVMGYLHDTHRYLRHALQALVEEGGNVHMHIALQPKRLAEISGIISKTCLREGYRPRIRIRTIKEYAPNVQHYVFDIDVKGKG